MTRLLFVTQTMDKNDSVLGAYHDWVAKLASHMERIIVICLYEGEYSLPENVRVYSLGKEKGRQHALVYARRFIHLVWRLRDEYDSAFVHMNQEYLLIAGWWWRLLGKRVYLWRNHYAGSWLTDIAASFCTTVFCTSKHSYTAKYAKTVFMPVGVDEERFHTDDSVKREPNSILFLARISPTKRPDIFIEALGHLLQKGINFTASVYGSPTPEDTSYYESLKRRAEDLGLRARVSFHPSVPNHETSRVYQAHAVSVNTSPSGMFDKTLFEAAGCGSLVLASSEDFALEVDSRLSFPYGDAEALALRLERLLKLKEGERKELTNSLEALAKQHSLFSLAERLVQEIH